MISLKMDLVELEAFSCLKQSTTHQIICEAGHKGPDPINHRVINRVIDHFKGLAPLPNQCLTILVVRLV